MVNTVQHSGFTRGCYWESRNVRSGSGRRCRGQFWMRRATCSSPRAIRTSRSARSPSASNTARLPSTATSPARTTSSSRWPRRGSGCCSPAPERAGIDGDDRSDPIDAIRAGVLALLRVQPAASRVLRADVRRPLGAADQPGLGALRVRRAMQGAARRADPARDRRRPASRRRRAPRGVPHPDAPRVIGAAVTAALRSAARPARTPTRSRATRSKRR